MRVILLFLIFVTASCVNSPLNPALDGSYRASNGEVLSFNQGRVEHIRQTREASEKTFVGIARNVQGVEPQLEIFAPDISPFIGTRFVFDQSSEQVVVDWNDFRPQGISRKSNYKKIGPNEPVGTALFVGKKNLLKKRFMNGNSLITLRCAVFARAIQHAAH